jgi:hypothetical protein
VLCGTLSRVILSVRRRGRRGRGVVYDGIYIWDLLFMGDQESGDLGAGKVIWLFVVCIYGAICIGICISCIYWGGCD